MRRKNKFSKNKIFFFDKKNIIRNFANSNIENRKSSKIIINKNFCL